MAIVEYLTNLTTGGLPSIPHLSYDDLQTRVRGNIYLELPQSDGSNCIITPSMSCLRRENSEERIDVLLKENSSVLEYLKDRLMYSLIVETAVLESASYFLEQNGYLLLARLKYFKALEKVLEIKLYTAPKKDLTAHYSDKIYIGRCFLNLEAPELKFNGLNLYVLSLLDQYDVVLEKANGRLNNPEKYQQTYFVEIHELVREVVGEVIKVLDSVPSSFDPTKWNKKEAIRIKSVYRGIKHLMLELADEVSEFENILRFNREDRYARYITKYRKDIKNIINSLNFNVLARLTYRIQEAQ